MFHLGKDVQIHPTARINVKHGFLGDRSILWEHVIIEGHHVEIGTEAFFNRYADLGGGSCFDPQAKLVAGDFLHVGLGAQINFCRPVTIGHEFGLGGKVFTHGAYQSAWEGFPVQWGEVTIGDRVWIPNALVHPGVTIGSNVVIAAGSLVNRDIPSGCLAGGIPAKVIRENVYPRTLTAVEKREVFNDIFNQARRIDDEQHSYLQQATGAFCIDGDTVFDIDKRRIYGRVTKFTELLKHQLRRNGIRFRYFDEKGTYSPWS